VNKHEATVLVGGDVGKLKCAQGQQRTLNMPEFGYAALKPFRAAALHFPLYESIIREYSK
jgi:hypothetical protein